uniref:Tight junction protein 3 n=1 Tax=Cyprinus carpio TaxID=7962 RepID=A0A8C1WFI5_CYPCA
MLIFCCCLLDVAQINVTPSFSFQKAVMEEMTIWEQHTVTLSKDPKVGFGFAVSGGLDKPVNGDAAVMVSDVLPSGPAMGRLQTQDQIVMVNGVSMENVTSLYTIQNLRKCGKTANITVKRPRTVQIPSSNRPTRSASQSNLLDDDMPQRRGQRNTDTSRNQRARSVTPDRNGHDLPIMSGFKRLPNQDVQDKPIRTTLIKKKPTDEYGMKLGSQIFIKHMTPTGLAAKEGSLQEGDLVLKINGMTTENLSLLETKHLVEKSRGKLSMLVLRDDRKFLVSIPEVEDSPLNSADERRQDSSSELEGESRCFYSTVLPDLPLPGMKSSSLSKSQDFPRRMPSPYRPPPRGDFHPIAHFSFNSVYSSDQNHVSFVKEGSVGLRLVGGNDVGIFVGGVQPNSPAQMQGMKEGDQILEVNGVDFNHFTREEAAMYLMNIHAGERIDIRTQNKMNIYKKILKSSLGDSFYIRTHFDHVAESSVGLSFTRGEVFRVVDTMHRGKLGTWLAVRMGNDLHELDKGTIPNQTKAETLANLEQAQRISAAERQASGPRAEFWKLRGLRGAKKNARRTRDDLLQLTIQGKYPAYEKVVLREANFKRPIVILGPLNDIANEKLARELPDEFEVLRITVLNQTLVTCFHLQEKHPLLDITPTAVERLNYIQYHPMVLFLDPHSRKDVKAMRQKYMPGSNKSSRRLYAQALKLRKHYSHLFCARIDLQPNINMWYDVLKDKIRQQQSKPVWYSVYVQLEGGGDEDLDAFSRADNSDYLSGASDYEDTDGEAITDGEAYTDNEDLDEPSVGITRNRVTALARSSEPATAHNQSPEPSYDPEPYLEEEPVYTLPPGEIPPILHVPEPRSPRLFTGSPQQQDDVPSQGSYTDSDFSTDDMAAPPAPSDVPPNFRAPDPKEVQSGTPPLSAIEKKLQQVSYISHTHATDQSTNQTQHDLVS